MSRLEPVELQQTDPDDPPPKSRPVSTLAPAKATLSSKKAMRRHRPVEKSAKRRAGR